MVDCKKCVHYSRCDIAHDFEEHVKRCRDFKPQTNADRIRAMSDEELYNLIEKIKMCGGLIRTETTSSECRGCKDGFCCNVLQWLKSEAKE